MIHNFMTIIIKKIRIYYLVLVLVVIIIPIIHYPRIYGVDSFQVIWMANALRNGALFSDNTWLIHPASYFGYYPFSHRAIGVPMILAFLISFLNFISFGGFGLTEAILAFDIMLILIIYKSSRNLGNRLFKEEWSRFIFVAAMLLSPNIIYDTTMTVSTRIIITIIMILLLNINLKILTATRVNKIKSIFFLFLILIVGALAHRLWMGTVITIIFMVTTFFIRKYEKLQHLTVLLILPLSIIALFFGLEFFWSEKSNLFGEGATFLEISTFLITYFGFWTGLISIFFPIGFMITLYKFTFTFKNNNAFKTSKKKNSELNISNQDFFDKFYYLLLFFIPFLYLIFTYFYALTIFLPILIIFSIQGLIFFKEFISNVYKKLGFNFKNLTFSHISVNPHKLKKVFWLIAIPISFLAYSEINIEISRIDVISNDYPWENRYLTNEEIEIIDYFQNEEINGLIFCAAGIHISERIGGVGFLPTFSGSTIIGIPLFYGLINPSYVHENAKLSLSELFRFNFYTYNEINPIEVLVNAIKTLDLRNGEDFHALVSYNVQYIISINSTFQSSGPNNWLLIQSLQLSDLFEPVFSTQHLLVWKIF